MSLPLDLLLKAVSETDPCGPDLLMEVDAYEERATPREASFSVHGAESAVQPPKWDSLIKEGTELLSRSKNIRTAVVLTLCSLKQNGLPGLRDGLTLITRLLQSYWEPVYPRIERGDPDGPLARANAIANLAQPFGRLGDPYQIIRHLRSTVLFSSAKSGPVTLGWLLTSKGIPPAESAGPILSADQVVTLLSEQPDGVVPRVAEIAQECLVELEGIESIFLNYGGQVSPQLDPLSKELRLLNGLFASFAGEIVSKLTTPVKTIELPTVMIESINGEIRSREQVVSALKAICQFYKSHEPSSPVPFLLQWAQRLVGRSFIDVIHDLAPDTESKIRSIIGHSEPKSE